MSGRYKSSVRSRLAAVHQSAMRPTVGKPKSLIIKEKANANLNAIEKAYEKSLSSELPTIAWAGGIDPRVVPIPPTQISQIFDKVPYNPGDPMQTWASRLYYFGNVADTMIARGGDLVHDIEKAVEVKSALMRMNMIDFMRTYPVIGSGEVADRITLYANKIPQIMRDFNAFRRVDFTPTFWTIEKTKLNELTTHLADMYGVTHIVYDAAFGNIFKHGFGSGMTYIKSAASEVDGASKFNNSTLRPYGITIETEHRPFNLPYFYGNTTHSISMEMDGDRQVKVSIGGKSVTVQCGSGISVNAICNLVKIPAPRGSGEAGKPVKLTGETTLDDSHNHIVFIKTMTDWAQLAYALGMTYRGVRCVFITNDEYCVALGAALGLPYIIRTPFASADYIEFYNFDTGMVALTVEEKAAIAAVIREPISADSEIYKLIDTFNKGRDRAIKCMESNKVPKIIIDTFTEDYNTAGKELNTIGAIFGHEPTDDLINKFRILATITRDAYMEAEVKRRLSQLHTKYVGFGVALQTEFHKKIAEDTTTISRIVPLIRDFVGPGPTNIMSIINSIQPMVIRVYGDSVSQYDQVRNPTKYFQYYLTSEFPVGVYRPPYNLIDHAQRWVNPEYSMKSAMWEIVKNIFSLVEYPKPASICNDADMTAINAASNAATAANVAAGKPPKPFVQEGGDREAIDNQQCGLFTITDETNTEIESMLEFIESVPSDTPFKPSHSKINEVLAAVPISFSSVQEKVQWIIDTLRLLQIDAFESNMGQEFEILMSDLDEIYELMVTDKITPTEMREQLEYVLTLHNVVVPIIDSISPDNQRALFGLIESIDEEPVASAAFIARRQANYDAALARGNTPAALGIAANLRAARAGRPSAAVAPVVAPTALSEPAKGFGKITTIFNLPKEPTVPAGVVTVPVTVTPSTGGARRSRRRRSTPRRVTRNKQRDRNHASRRPTQGGRHDVPHASRRRRTIRRRK